MRRAVLAGIVSLVVSVACDGQPTLHLKNREIDTSAGLSAPSAKSLLKAADYFGRIHLLLQFTHLPGEAEAEVLAGRGAVVVGYVHENGWVIAIDAGTSLDNLDLQWAGILDPDDKISREFDETADAQPVLVEFHSDVDLATARELVLSVDAQLRDHPDTAVNQLLVVASPAQIRGLARLDAVAYIFPASDDLAAGRPMIACASGMTVSGGAGQYIAKIGEGWDGPGLGTASLTYTWGSLTQQLPTAAAQSEIVRALGEWSKVAAITFQLGSGQNLNQNINILFARRDHGDPYAFDGPGATLAHTFYPSPPNPEPLAGDMHFDDDEHWQIGADVDLFSVALHELGHALGLGHSDRPGTVMYPYYQRATTLTNEDVGAIQSLYAAPGTPPPTPVSPTVPTDPTQPLSLILLAPPATTTNSIVSITGTVTGGTGDVKVAWTSDRGVSGMASGTRSWSFSPALSIGINNITITATDSQKMAITKTVTVTRIAPATSTPPPPSVTLTITYPGSGAAYTTSNSSVQFSGTAVHATGIRKVEWWNSRGGSGTASGTTSWQTGTITLSDGVNAITVRATATDNSSASATVQVTYSRNVRDTAAPVLTITSPSGNNIQTADASIVLKGTARDNVGVASVSWFTSGGDSGNAAGTTSWQTAPVPVLKGYNTIVIRAFDAAGNMAWRTIQVTRQ